MANPEEIIMADELLEALYDDGPAAPAPAPAPAVASPPPERHLIKIHYYGNIYDNIEIQNNDYVDPYHWRATGGSSTRRSYRCISTDCPAKKRVDRDENGTLFCVVYYGDRHDHAPGEERGPRPWLRGAGRQNQGGLRGAGRQNQGRSDEQRRPWLQYRGG